MRWGQDESLLSFESRTIIYRLSSECFNSVHYTNAHKTLFTEQCTLPNVHCQHQKKLRKDDIMSRVSASPFSCEDQSNYITYNVGNVWLAGRLFGKSYLDSYINCLKTVSLLEKWNGVKVWCYLAILYLDAYKLPSKGTIHASLVVQ